MHGFPEKILFFKAFSEAFPEFFFPSGIPEPGKFPAVFPLRTVFFRVLGTNRMAGVDCRTGMEERCCFR